MMTDLVERARPARGSWHDDLPVAGVAAGAAGALWGAAWAAGIALDVHAGSGTQPVGLVSVLVTAVVVTLVGGTALRVLSRRRRRRWWKVVALGVLTLSMLGPLSAASAAAGLVLATMHLVVGGVVVIGLPRRALA